jgi:hypothetical protein
MGLTISLLGCGVVTKFNGLEGERWGLRTDEARLVEAPTGAPDDLSTLDDEFNDPATFGRWQILSKTEGWPDQVKRLDVNVTNAGRLHLEPYTSFWFGDFHAPYLYKSVTGDSVVTTLLDVSGAHDTVPQQGYSLAGLLVRSPHQEGALAWKEKTENWFFITAGTGDGDHTPQYETKNTLNGSSKLELTPRKVGSTELLIARVGSRFTLMRRVDGEPWTVLRRLDRPDLPATLQVGLTAYTDYDTSKWYLILNRVTAYHRDAAKLARDGVPDLIANFDYVHFRRPR